MEENVGKSFKAPQTRIAPMNLGGEKKRNMNAGKQDQNQQLYTEELFFGKKLNKRLIMRFCAILILSVISILNSLELKSQTVVKILSNGCKVERSLFLNEKKNRGV